MRLLRAIRHDAQKVAGELLKFCWCPLMLAILEPGLSVYTDSSWGGLTRSGRDSIYCFNRFFFAIATSYPSLMY
ncbi:MAG: hypothetical protein AAF572_18130 [Cyanobacteria bacterium P01_B01_bin.77]